MIRFNLMTGCLLSLGVHAGVLFFIPGMTLQLPSPVAVPTEAELVEIEVPLPPELQPPVPTPAPVVNQESQAAAQGSDYDAAKIVPPDMQKIAGAIEKMSPGEALQLPSPTLQLPDTNTLQDTTPPESSRSVHRSALTTALLEQSLQPAGVTSGVDKQLGWGQVRLGDKQSPSRLPLPKLDQRLVSPTLPAPTPLAMGPPVQPQFGIQGPAAKREPLYRPPPPKVEVHVENDIALKFWVRPDGVVSRILPERKGDARLEAAAIQYLEGWRFTPLPPHEPQVEQWGTITVRFRLPER